MKAPDRAAFTVVLQDGTRFATNGSAQTYIFSRAGHEDLVFCVPKLAQLRAEQPGAWETIEIPVVASDAAMIATQRGIEVAHLNRLRSHQLDEPGLAVFLEDGSFLIVDGNHRYVKRANIGRAGMRFHVCRPPTWRAALIDIAATRRGWEGERT
jgi:hypothetical protein